MTENTIIGARIAKARTDMGLSRRQVAAQIGVNDSTLEGWERRRVVPRANKLQTLCGVLNVSVAWLLEGGNASFDRGAVDGDDMAKLTEKLRQALAMQRALGNLLEDVSVEIARLRGEKSHQGDLAA